MEEMFLTKFNELEYRLLIVSTTQHEFRLKKVEGVAVEAYTDSSIHISFDVMEAMILGLVAKKYKEII